ncbi:MAG: nucleoside monophosphate kinase [Candidatus Peregrinibacteria bacterium]
MHDIVFFGMQGAGKGTQGKILAEKKGLTIFETGAELRSIMAEPSNLGQKVKGMVEKGELVTNEIVMEIVEHFLNAHEGDRILFDGIPRSIIQKETFDALLQRKGRSVFGIFLTIPREEAISRMLLRGRADDTPEIMERRLKNYDTETLPVIEKYESEGKMVRVEGIGSIEEIHEGILSAVETRLIAQ